MKALCINNLISNGDKLTYLTVNKVYNVIGRLTICNEEYYKITDDRNNTRYPELYRANRFIIICSLTKLKIL